jgi:cyclophilin family peptidyl-prolyl cis-trans isomerase
MIESSQPLNHFNHQEISMTQKKRSSNSRTPAAGSKQHANAANPNATIQSIALVVLLVAVAAIIWAVVSSRQPAQTAVPGAGDEGSAPELVGTKTYSSAPPMLIDPSKNYTATVKMAKGGEFDIQLHADKAPVTVNSFVFLAREGFYDGVTFHRVLDGFMAQGGDPDGTGMGGPGYEFINEDSDLTFDQAGLVAMANAGRDTNGSQFFVTFSPQERLNGGYTIFGQVTSGMDVVNGLTRRNPEETPTFEGDVIETITITEE